MPDQQKTATRSPTFPAFRQPHYAPPLHLPTSSLPFGSHACSPTSHSAFLSYTLTHSHSSFDSLFPPTNFPIRSPQIVPSFSSSTDVPRVCKRLSSREPKIAPTRSRRKRAQSHKISCAPIPHHFPKVIVRLIARFPHAPRSRDAQKICGRPAECATYGGNADAELARAHRGG